jgi:hypothetical protein
MTRDWDEGIFTRRKFKLGFRRWFAEKMERKTLRAAPGCVKVHGLFHGRAEFFV